MNLRYILALCGLVLMLVSQVAGEGGPIDGLTGHGAPASDEGQAQAAAATAASAASPGLAPGVNDFVADYSADDGEDFADGPDSFAPPPVVTQRAPTFAALSGGALSDTRLRELGVELPAEPGFD